MRKFWFIAALAIVALIVVVNAASSQEMKCIKANAQGEIVIEQQAMIGNTALPPGKYVLQSSDKDGKHYVHFVEESKHFEVHPETSEQTFKEHVADVPCLQEHGEKAKTTAIFYTEEGGMMHIKKAAIQGEEYVHVF
jgi:hypothetical protein